MAMPPQPCTNAAATGDRFPQNEQPVSRRNEGLDGHNNAPIMAVLCLVIGMKLIGDVLSGLSS